MLFPPTGTHAEATIVASTNRWNKNGQESQSIFVKTRTPPNGGLHVSARRASEGYETAQ